MVTKSDNSVIDFKFNSSSFIKLFLNLNKFLLNLFSLFIGQTRMDKSLWSHDLTTLYTCIVHFCTQPTHPLLYPCICLLAGRTLSKCGENIVYLWGELLSLCTATSLVYTSTSRENCVDQWEPCLALLRDLCRPITGREILSHRQQTDRTTHKPNGDGPSP